MFFVYLHKILIFSHSHEEHMDHVRELLRRLLENRLFVKAEKCEFHVNTVNFLGFVVEKGQLRADPSKFKGWLLTANSCSASWVSFNCSHTATPLMRLTSNKLPFSWSHDAFNQLKNLFTNAPVLTHPDPEQQFVVEVDTSDSGVGAVASQRLPVDRKLHPCAFFFCCLSPVEQNYDVGN